MQTYNIEPIHIRAQATMVNLGTEIILNPKVHDETYCKVQYRLFDAEGAFVDYAYCSFTREELADWADDDDILITKAAAKLGWTITQ